ncbi:maleate cis-trans isomerase family protein [Allokutzneria oryzae]|uniref:Maleate cis-trans isomerase n=1 Tax=Allokutzneria oryzae TaxID=1378989 RepID=A0ABV6A980_9PSEU
MSVHLGVLVIHNDPVPETELWAMAPPGVTVHAARFDCPREPGAEYVGSSWQAVAHAPDVVRALNHLGQLGVTGMSFCFGSPSFFGGAAFDSGFMAEATRLAGGVPVRTAAVSMTEALRASGVRRPFVVMPPWFTEPTFVATDRFLADNGLSMAGLLRFELGADWRSVPPYESFDAGARWSVNPEEVRRQVRRALPATADGVLVPGSGFRSAEAIEPLERELGVPVITSNQACLWHGLRAAGHSAPVRGFGRLFGRDLPVGDPAETRS